MPSAIRTPGLITAFCAFGFAVPGQALATTATEGAASPVIAPARVAPAAKSGTRAPAPSRGHLLSSGLAAIVASGLPKYQPPKVAGTQPGEETSVPGMASAATNDIIRLERFIVQEPKPPVFTERQLYTKKGLAELAMKRQPGLKFGNILGMNEGLALKMYAEQERLDNLAALADEANATRDHGDAAMAKAIEHERIRVMYRPSDIGGRIPAPSH